jgi:hypothetical protein
MMRIEILDPTAPPNTWVGNAKEYDSLRAAWDGGIDLLARWSLPRDFRVMGAIVKPDVPVAQYSCSLCPEFVRGDLAPSHRGSDACESGSLASGGDRTHCSCDVCF